MLFWLFVFCLGNPKTICASEPPTKKDQNLEFPLPKNPTLQTKNLSANLSAFLLSSLTPFSDLYFAYISAKNISFLCS